MEQFASIKIRLTEIWIYYMEQDWLHARGGERNDKD